MSVSGQSYDTDGTVVDQGASFSGQGGSCDSDHNYTYSTYLNFGSMGKEGDLQTAGGGRIIINADSVQFGGLGAKLKANGLPNKDYALE